MPSRNASPVPAPDSGMEWSDDAWCAERSCRAGNRPMKACGDVSESDHLSGERRKGYSSSVLCCAVLCCAVPCCDVPCCDVM
jgi:hypothetical protein